MRLSTRNTFGLAAVAAVALTTAVGGSALASRGADDVTAAPSSTSAGVQDDKGGLTDRDLRFEPGDDRRPNGAITPTTIPSPGVPSASPTHDAGDDHGRHHEGLEHARHGADDGADDSAGDGAQHDAGDDHGGSRSGHGSGDGADDGAQHDAGDDHGGSRSGHGSDDV